MMVLKAGTDGLNTLDGDMGGFVIDEESLDSVPHQLRLALHKHKLRVVDLFRQMDDDASG